MCSHNRSFLVWDSLCLSFSASFTREEKYCSGPSQQEDHHLLFRYFVTIMGSTCNIVHDMQELQATFLRIPFQSHGMVEGAFWYLWAIGTYMPFLPSRSSSGISLIAQAKYRMVFRPFVTAGGQTIEAFGSGNFWEVGMLGNL